MVSPVARFSGHATHISSKEEYATLHWHIARVITLAIHPMILRRQWKGLSPFGKD